MKLSVGYFTGTYPRATDIWLQREIQALRECDVEVVTAAVRRPDHATLTSDGQRREADETVALLPASPFRLALTQARLLARGPGRYGRTLRLARATSAPGWRAQLRQMAYFVEAGSLATEIRRRRLSHVHNHLSDSSCTVTMLAAELAGVTYSFTIHGPSIFFETELWRVDEKIRRAAFVNCISWFCRSQAATLVEPEHWAKLKVIHCGIDRSTYDPLVATRHRSRRVDVDRTITRLVFVGRLAHVKGLDVLLPALVELRAALGDVRLTVVGDGPERGRLTAVAALLGLADVVELVGAQAPDAVRDVLAEADVFVLPSFAEGVPVVLMEAMAAGIPVVTTQIAGVPELVEHDGTGLLVPPSDQAALVAAITRMLTEPGLAGRLSSAAADAVFRDFDVAVEARRHMASLLAPNQAGTLPPRPSPVA
jgi:colanic acid/amylovoran biosynthesis glycosyltransferase